eukprot:1566-Heterococcus_DN1.PRE.1
MHKQATVSCVGLMSAISSASGHSDAVTCMTGPLKQEGVPTTEYIVTGSLDNSLRVWNAATGDKVHEVDCKARLLIDATQSITCVGGTTDKTILVLQPRRAQHNHNSAGNSAVYIIRHTAAGRARGCCCAAACIYAAQLASRCGSFRACGSAS